MPRITKLANDAERHDYYLGYQAGMDGLEELVEGVSDRRAMLDGFVAGSKMRLREGIIGERMTTSGGSSWNIGFQFGDDGRILAASILPSPGAPVNDEVVRDIVAGSPPFASPKVSFPPRSERIAPRSQRHDIAGERGLVYKSWNFVDSDGNPAGGQYYGQGIDIRYQNGPVPLGKRPTGAFVEDVIRAAIERLSFYEGTEYDSISDGRFACQENEMSLFGLRLALWALQQRTAKRVGEGVEGTHTAHSSG